MNSLRAQKALGTALKHAKGGAAVVLIVPDHTHVRPAMLALVAADYGGVWDKRYESYTPKNGAPLYVVSAHKDRVVDVQSLRVRGYPDDKVFWCPEVIEEHFARVLKEFHRYD